MKKKVIGSKEFTDLKVTKKWRILTKEMRKLLKSNIGTICKWCEKRELDSLMCWDLELFRKYIPNAEPWEVFELDSCTRCGTKYIFSK